LFDDVHRLGVEHAPGGALLRSVVESDKEEISGALKESPDVLSASWKRSNAQSVRTTTERTQ
jgi:hypothetical protein